MKKWCTQIFVLLISFNCHSQNRLWCLTMGDNQNSTGTLVNLNSNGSDLIVSHIFNYTTGCTPKGSLHLSSNGKFYGTCYDGGANASCVLFSYDTLSGIYTDEFDFSGLSGDYPSSGVVESNGKLFGVTTQGGVDGDGVIYSFDVSLDSLSVIYNFQYQTGSFPVSAPIIIDNHILYGTTNQNGASGYGVIYRFDISNNSYSVLHDFIPIHGTNPVTGLLFHEGKLYGTTTYGGGLGNGTLFSLDTLTNTFINLYSFGSLTGHPLGSLVDGADETLIGTTSQGGANQSGTIFKFDLTNNAYSVIYDFDTLNGRTPSGDLLFGSDGLIYGTTMNGGINNNGVIFKFDTTDNVFNKIFDFNSIVSGVNPNGGLIEISNFDFVGREIVLSEISISPNPATNEIKITNLSTEENQIKIFNLLGQQVKNISVSNEQNRTINISDLSSGIYMLTVSNNKKVSCKKFVKE